MLELKDIKKSYIVGETRQEVLKGINIKFRKNEFTSILGPSGCGKTTLLNIIGGLDKYDSGDLVIEGTSTKNYGDKDWDAYRNYRVGFIFQSYNLIMHQSVFSNVEIALTLSGVSKSARKKKVLDALEKVGLKEHANKKPNQLSGGQMQRVAIARALVNDPEIVLADEPTGALDSKTSVQIMDLLKEISKDKLIVMVTHNPELAKEYSNRIVELKDGLIVNDSNPYNGEEEVSNQKKLKHTSMSLLTSLSLSFNNLLTKKGRTFLTAFAGSIGIIGIALILSLSNGVSNYVSNLEKESLSDYPINIEKSSYDLVGSLTAAFSTAAENSQNQYNDGKLHSEDDVVSSSVNTSEGLLQRNNLKEFKKYVDGNEEINKNADAIIYGYNLELQVYTTDGEKVNPTDLKQDTASSGEISIFKELENRESVLKDKYEVLSGNLPEKENEIVLVVGEDSKVPDTILYSLGLKNKKNLKDEFNKFYKDSNYKVESTSYSYEDFVGKTYKLILNTDYYKEENGIYIDYSSNKDYMKDKINQGIDLEIVGVVKEKDGSGKYIGYRHELVLSVINEISKTDIYKKQMENQDINVLTGEEFDGMIDTFEKISEKLGIFDIEDPSSISIYPKDYNAKETIVKLIDKYNEEKRNSGEGELEIKYTDLLKSLAGGVTKVVKMVSFILIGFVAISLIVSSIMIAIITYISVLERTKEIGILRAIGATKKDIKRVFRAETIIEGAIAGLLGVGIALLIDLPINLIVKGIAKIDGIASLPFLSALILILLSILLNVIAGTKPSGIAAKKDPVESLRNE